MTNYKNGFNHLNHSIYVHSPSSEKSLFKDVLLSYTQANEGDILGVEIGVLNGETSGFFLSLHNRIKLIGIDPLIPDSMEQSLIGSYSTIASNTERYGARFTFVHDYSYNYCNNFDNESIDFLFIDGDHTYSAVKKDYEDYFPKVKTNGYIFFHDSRMYRGGANFHIGSSKFCDEVLAKDIRIELIGEAFSLTCVKKK